MSKFFESLIQAHKTAVSDTFTPDVIAVLQQMVKVIEEAIRGGNKILLCGNGGSAADSQHIAAEFIGRFQMDRESLPAVALTTDTSILTAVGNDYGFDEIFSRQVAGLGRKGDILIGISTSGNSPNVLKAVQKARSMGMKTIGFTGSAGGKLKNEVELCFQTESSKTSIVQEIHILALHGICEAVEASIAKTA